MICLHFSYSLGQSLPSVSQILSWISCSLHGMRENIQRKMMQNQSNFEGEDEVMTSRRVFFSSHAESVQSLNNRMLRNNDCSQTVSHVAKRSSLVPLLWHVYDGSLFQRKRNSIFLWLPLNCDVNTVQTTVVSSLFTMTFMSWVIHRPCSSLCQFVLGMLLCHKEVCKEHWKISQAKEEANEMKFFTAENLERHLELETLE